MKYLKVWTSFRDVIQPLTDAEKGRLFDMMLLYADSGEEPEEFVGNERFTWPAAKQSLDLMISENIRLTENGRKGGRPKTNENQEKPTETNGNQSEPNKSQKEKKRNEMKGNEKEGNDILILEPRKRFQPPTADDVRAYCEEKGSFWIDPERFVDYYESRGWILTNGKKMVDWKAAVRLWEKNEKERQEKSKFVDDLPY